MNKVKLFLDDTFASGVSIDNVFNSLGGDLNGIVFFLQSFEVWLDKRASKQIEPQANTAEARFTASNNASVQLPRSCKVCILKKHCDAEYAMEQCWRNAVTAHFA